MKHLACRAAACTSLAALLFAATPARAATISFVPAGAQLDGDAILDIDTAVGNVISFDVFIDTAGLADPLQNFKYTASWDPAELTRTGLAMDPGNHFAVNTPPGAFLATGSTVSHTGGAVPAGAGQFLLDTWTFTVADGLVNDGKVDFGVVVFNAESVVNGKVVNQNGKYDVKLPNGLSVPGFQQVEVQPTTDAPEPSEYALMLAGAGSLLWWRKHSQRRSSHQRASGNVK